MKILVIEDNKELAENIKTYLELEDFEVSIALAGNEAKASLLSSTYDCIVMDLNLPEVDGIELSEFARKNEIQTPIVILTARTSTEWVVKGLNVGADDYIRKPFEMDELIARINSAIRRSKNIISPIIKIKYIKIDTNKKEVLKYNKPVKLAPKEYQVLEYLALNPNKVQDRVKILEDVWGESDDLLFSQTVDVHIAYLRKKLGKEIIKTGIGGYFVEL